MWCESGSADSMGTVNLRLKCRRGTWNFYIGISRGSSPMSVDLDALLP